MRFRTISLSLALLLGFLAAPQNADATAFDVFLDSSGSNVSTLKEPGSTVGTFFGNPARRSNSRVLIPNSSFSPANNGVTQNEVLVPAGGFGAANCQAPFQFLPKEDGSSRCRFSSGGSDPLTQRSVEDFYTCRYRETASPTCPEGWEFDAGNGPYGPTLNYFCSLHSAEAEVFQSCQATAPACSPGFLARSFSYERDGDYVCGYQCEAEISARLVTSHYPCAEGFTQYSRAAGLMPTQDVCCVRFQP